MWVEQGRWHDVQKLEEAAIHFETHIYTATRATFGSEWTPGVDNDPHILVVHATGLGENVLGYTSSADEFPRDLHPFSNEAEMITVNDEYAHVGTPAYYALLTRQFQRLIQWTHDRNEERWIKAGLAELAARLNYPEPGRIAWDYLERPDTSLTAWPDSAFETEAAAPHRGAAYLFATYFHERFGDRGTRSLVAQPLNGVAGVDATLAELGTALSFKDLFAEWLVANYADSETDTAAGNELQESAARYSYASLDLERPALAAIYEDYPVALEASVQQFGADYILLQDHNAPSEQTRPNGNGDLRILFTGASTTPLLDLSPHSGRAFWWSNHADESLTTLTRAFDLSDTERATLNYWTWYDIEADYDYATVEISTDGGEKWQVLQTPFGTDADPHGNNPGWGYTGQSGDPPQWIKETVDLSAYAGEEVLLRFAYLTDEAITGTGFVLDDITIPEIDYVDDAEGEKNEWKSDGFVHTDNSVPQRYLASLVSIEEDQITVVRLPVNEDQTGNWTVPLGSEGWAEAILVISGLAPLTTHPALYQLAIE